MSAAVSHIGWRARRWGLAEPMGWLLLGALAAWVVAVLSSFARGGFTSAPRLGLIVLAPVVFVTGAMLSRRRANPVLTWAAWVSAGLALALLTALLFGGQLAVLALPAACLAAVLFGRWPAAGLTLAFVFTAAQGTLAAFTRVPVGATVDLILVGLWLSVIWTYLLRRRVRAPVWVWPGVAGLLLYLLLTFFEIVTAPSLWIGLQAYRVSAWYILAAFLVAYGPWALSTRDRVAKAAIVVAAAAGGYATLRWQIGPAAQERALAIRATETNFLDDKLGVIGSFVSRHALGAWTAVAVPFCCGYALAARDRWRIVAAAAAALCGTAVLATDVRAAFAAAVAGLVVVLVLHQLAPAFGSARVARSLAAVLVLGLLGVAAFAITVGNDGGGSRYRAIINPSSDGAYQARLVKWRTAMRDLQGHPFGFGLGSGGRASALFSRFRGLSAADLDSSYVKIAYEQGPAVLALFCVAVLLLLAGMVQRVLTTRDRWRAGLGAASAGTLVTLMVLFGVGLYIEGFGALAGWVLVGLGMAQFAFKDDGRAAEATH